ncbi:MAG: hypothetical protein WAU45_23365 [Blastocatellia bacterium]
MRRISLIAAMIALLVGIPVQAQKKVRGIMPPTPEPTTLVTVKDDGGGGFLHFDLKSGEFKCYLCEYDYALTGFGEVKIDGCNLYFSAITADYRMFASLNMCEHQGKSAVEIFRVPDSKFGIESMFEYWTDTDMNNSTPDCSPPQK